MTDLTAQMREAAKGDDWPLMATLLVKGASEIERLRNELETAQDNEAKAYCYGVRDAQERM